MAPDVSLSLGVDAAGHRAVSTSAMHSTCCIDRSGKASEIIEVIDSSDEEQDKYPGGLGGTADLDLDLDLDSEGFLTPPLPPNRSISSIPSPSYYEPPNLLSHHTPSSSTVQIFHSAASISIAALENETESIPQSPSVYSGSVYHPEPSTSPIPNHNRGEDDDDQLPTPPGCRRGRPSGSKNRKERVIQETMTLEGEAQYGRSHDLEVGIGVPLEEPYKISEGARRLFEDVTGTLEMDSNPMPPSGESQTIEEKLQASAPTQIQEPDESVALLPDFVFEAPDESMFADLRAFLDEQEGSSISSSSSDGEEGGDDKGEDEYERQRLKRLRANEAILSRLGLAAPAHASSSPAPATSPNAEVEQQIASLRATPAKRVYKRMLKIDADGLTTSLPLPGCTLEIACVDIPVLRVRARAQSLYYPTEDVLASDPAIFESDEEEETNEEDDSDPQPDAPSGKRLSAQRKAMEERAHQKKVKKPGRIYRSPDPPRGVPRGEGTQGVGTTCHQCRRKTDLPKMRCRHHESGRVCPLYWCERCLDIRYGIDFDKESRIFQCPRCLGYCNCSLCLRQAGLTKFIPESINAGLSTQLNDDNGQKVYASVRHYIDVKVGRSLQTGPVGLRKGQTAEQKQAKEEKKMVKRARKAEEQAARQTEQLPRSSSRQSQRKRRLMAEESEEQSDQFKPTVQEIRDESAIAPIKKIKLRLRKKQEEIPKLTSPAKRRAKQTSPSWKDNAIQSATAMEPARLARAGLPSPGKAGNSTVWVKSKADTFVSSSDSEEEDEGWYNGRNLLTTNLIDDDNESLTSLSELSEIDEEEEDEDTQDAPVLSSPQIGQVEYSRHPELTIPDDYHLTPDDLPSINHTSGLSTEASAYVNAFTNHSGQDMAFIMSQLRDAGYV